jgi:hypothetical protein
MGTRVSIKDAADVGERYGHTRVMIIATDDRTTETVSWGKTPEYSGYAAMDVQKLRAVLEARPTSLEEAVAAAARVHPADIQGTLLQRIYDADGAFPCLTWGASELPEDKCRCDNCVLRRDIECVLQQTRGDRLGNGADPVRTK